MYVNISNNVFPSPHNTLNGSKLILLVYPELMAMDFGYLKHAGSNPHFSIQLNTNKLVTMLTTMTLMGAKT